ncbi:MAG: HlyC/CorC family transporter [Erysipelotrichales bacterium]|nr:MAG: HlyC/CorC family transporter [Erysipelotrichales bacterium]
MIAQLGFLIVLIIANAFFAASEIAMISLNDNKVRLMAEDGDVKAIQVQKLLSQPTRFLSTIQIGITLAGFLASAFASETFALPLVDLIKTLNLAISDSLLKTFAMIFITLLLSLFTLVLGELVPKRIAMNMAEPIAFRVVGILRFVSILTRPLVVFLTVSTNFFIRLFGFDPNQQDDEVTEEEIRMMVDVGEEKGTIRDTEKEMINNIFDFDNKVVSDIMTHRTEIAGIPLDAKFGEVLRIVADEKYTRFPVYDQSIDDIIGVMHSKDLLQFIERGEQDKFDLNGIIRAPFYVHESKRIDELFRELQLTKTHIAVVIDEYGGTGGIVTIEDLVEEIVGNIFDEYDEDEVGIKQIDESTFDVEGSTTLDELEEDLNINLPIEEFDTISGFIIGQLGRIPSDGEQPEVTVNGVLYRVLKVDEKRISKVQIVKPEVINGQEE